MGAQTAEARAEQAARLVACRIRWECQGLKGAERKVRGRELLSQVPQSQQAAVIEALKGMAK